MTQEHSSHLLCKFSDNNLCVGRRSVQILARPHFLSDVCCCLYQWTSHYFQLGLDTFFLLFCYVSEKRTQHFFFLIIFNEHVFFWAREIIFMFRFSFIFHADNRTWLVESFSFISIYYRGHMWGLDRQISSSVELKFNVQYSLRLSV